MKPVIEATRWIVENAGNLALCFVMITGIFFLIFFLISRLTWWTKRDDRLVKRAGAFFIMLLNLVPLFHKKRK